MSINAFNHVLKDQLSIQRIYVIVVINFVKHAAKETIKMLVLLAFKDIF